MKGILRKMLVELLLENSFNIYIKDHLKCYLDDDPDEEFQKLNPIFDYILADGYNIKGFGLFEIPTEGVYCFYSKSHDEQFDIYVSEKGEIKAGYISGSEEIYAQSIQAAIQGFKENT